MITLWMLYCLGVSVLLGIAASACEYVLRGRGVPLRGVWVCAMAMSLFLPLWGFATSPGIVDNVPKVTAVTRTIAEPPTAPDHRAPLIGTAAIAISMQSGMERTLESLRPLLNAMGPAILAIWVSSTLLLGLFLLGGWLRIRSRRSRWRQVQLDGREVMISDCTGPAVVGFLRPTIVLPEWILQLEKGRRALVLLHEEEHLRAHDERLLFLASVALVVMPCNLALWYQVRRLRLAVEIDCDARVLRVHPDPREYGDLLLAVGSRATSNAMQMAALSEPVSFLARRIAAMMTARRQSRPAAMVTLVVAIAAGTIAWQTPRPPLPTFGSSLRPTGPLPGLRAEHDSQPAIIWDGERMTQDSLVRRLYGKGLSLVGSGVLEFVVDADGIVRSAGVRSGPTAYRSADTMVLRRGFKNGYGNVPASDVASIEVDRTGYGFPEISSVIWVRLKPGARMNAGDRARGPERGATGRSISRDSALIVDTRASAQAATRLDDSVDSQARLVERITSQLARHEAETVRLRAEMVRNAADAELLRARFAALDTQAAALGLAYGSGSRGYVTRAPKSREAMEAVAQRYYPELFNNPPAAQLTLWFLADSADRVIETLIQRAPLGMVGEAQVVSVFPAIARERLESWTVTSPYPFGIVWVRVRR